MHCWAEIDWPTDPKKKTHRQENAEADVVRDFAVAHMDELKNLMVLCGRALA